MSSPAWRERLKPAELVGLAAVVAVFIGFVVILSTRDPMLALIFAGVAFIASLMVLAMLALVHTSEPETTDDRPVLMREDRKRRRR